MTGKHIKIPTLIFTLLALAACGNMNVGVTSFEANSQGSPYGQQVDQGPAQQADMGSSGYYGYEEAMDTYEEVVQETLAPAKDKKDANSTKTTSPAPAKSSSAKNEAEPAKETEEKTSGKTSEVAEEKAEPKAEPKKSEQPAPKTEEPVLSKTPNAPRSEVVGPGILKPTVYFFAILNEDKNGCKPETRRTLHGAGSKPLLKVCPKTAAACSLQGSCGVIQKGKMHTFNIIGRFDGQDRYFEIPEDGCRFGYGVNSSCLDPFYTLAADLTIYKPGEVIFVPAVVGLELPDGSKHNGYFVIRDKGRGIKGMGRFDFFSGHYSWNDSENPFKKIGLGDVNTNIPYYRIKGEAAKKVQASRAFPSLPPHAVTE
nr:hypothetical protein HAGR004_34110 [Bdellovibrio sp. HAGR004]